MKCEFTASGERHRSGRQTLRCSRCKQLALMPPSGDVNRLVAICRGWPFPHELGHWLSLLLAALWIRKRDYLWLKARLGFKAQCGCDAREKKLNAWGAWLRRV